MSVNAGRYGKKRGPLAPTQVHRHEPARPCYVIECDHKSPRDGFIGVFWFDSAPLPVHLDAYRVAAFRTQSAARAALRGVKKWWPRARVVRVWGHWVAEGYGFRRHAPTQSEPVAS